MIKFQTAYLHSHLQEFAVSPSFAYENSQLAIHLSEVYLLTNLCSRAVSRARKFLIRASFQVSLLRLEDAHFVPLQIMFTTLTRLFGS